MCEGFVGQAATTSDGLGLPNLPVAMVPGHVDMQTDNELRDNVLGVTLEQVIANLTEQPAAARSSVEPGPEEIVFEGSFEEINRLFYENRWSDGLPFVPPTREKIEEFLEFTDLPADHVLGQVPPDNRVATVRSVAANGVMAGCRPEYMPILGASAKAMADPAYGVEHSGNTPGAETLVTINGPLIKELGFNYEQGALRDGFMANTTVGRFWRLYLRNVAGFLPHRTDKGTYGNTWRVVLAENEDVLSRIGWEPLAADFGFGAGENAITISRYTGGDVVTSVYGQTPERMLPYIADALVKQSGWQLVFTVGMARGTARSCSSPRSSPRPSPRGAGRAPTSSGGCSRTPACRRPSSRCTWGSTPTWYRVAGRSPIWSKPARRPRSSPNRAIRSGRCLSSASRTTSSSRLPETRFAPMPTCSPITGCWAIRWRSGSIFRATGRESCGRQGAGKPSPGPACAPGSARLSRAEFGQAGEPAWARLPGAWPAGGPLPPEAGCGPL